MKRPLSWFGMLIDSAFVIILGCSVVGAVAAVYHIVTDWRSAWRIW